MALHTENFLAVAECLQQSLKLAEMGIHHRLPGGGCLGYPAANLLFDIVDAIGSYHRKRNLFIQVGTEQTTISNPNQHFLILNSRFYEQNLDRAQIDILYSRYRCPLTHNASLVPNCILEIGGESEKAFEFEIMFPRVRLVPFLVLTKSAVGKFLESSRETVQLSTATVELIAKKYVPKPLSCQVHVASINSTASSGCL